MVVHAFRHHAFVPEATWRLDGDRLIIQSERQDTRVPLSSVTEFRLAYDPTRVALDRYRCDLRLTDGRRLTLLNKFYVSFGEFETRNETYGAFVRALAAAVYRANPACRFRIGRGRWRYVSGIMAMTVTLLVLSYLLLVTGGTAISWIVVAKLAILLVMVPFAISYIRKNRPRPFDPQAVPETLLPPAEVPHRVPG